MRLQATALLAVLCACRESPGVSPSPGASTIEAASSVAIALEIYDGTPRNGWKEQSGAGDAGPHGPAGVDFSKGGSWTLVRAVPPSEPSAFGGVTFRMKMAAGEGEFLEVQLGGPGSSTFPAVKLSPDQRRELPGGWVEVLVPMSALDPQGVAFDQVTLRAFREVTDGHVQLAKLALAAPTSGQLPGRSSQPSASAVVAAPGRPVSLSVDCSAVARPIDPMIYGIAMNVTKGPDDPASWGLGATARRWGGNTTSRYNWELGNAWSTGQDWFYENVKVSSYSEFLAADAAHNVKSALTVPTLGWVAKDTTSSSFPVTMFGAQQATDQYRTDAG
ncbi:MAG TPA: glycoside hydrolase family 44 protein, partial [Polyangiaceae bacterium]